MRNTKSQNELKNVTKLIWNNKGVGFSLKLAVIIHSNAFCE